MKQMQVSFNTIESLDRAVRKIRQWRQRFLGSVVLIQIYTEILDQTYINKVVRTISSAIPEAIICGCSSNGNILNGEFAGDSFVLVSSFFEYPSTKVEALSFNYNEMSQKNITERLKSAVDAHPWVKGVQMLSKIRGMSMTELCDRLSDLKEDIQIFGGAAFAADLENDESCVFTGDEYLENGIVFLLFGGDDFYIDSRSITGWKPLGSYLHVTKAEGSVLKELNGQPAYDIYYKYLHIKNDEHFFYNTLEFPFLYRHHNIDIMRAPTASNSDGSLIMTSDIEEGVLVRIAYGDPWTILETTYEAAKDLLSFAPESITVYSVTQVIVAMREGEPRTMPDDLINPENKEFEGKVSMINRMATFITATTDELEEANRRLHEMAVKDALTGVWNKAAYFSKVAEINSKDKKDFSVAVFDMNGLKGVNDTLGHECGDTALQHICDNLTIVFGAENLYRIGGDEFIAVIDHADEAKMMELFKKLDLELEIFNKTEHIYKIPLSISKGYSVFNSSEDREYIDTFRKADNAMYRDKAEYYKLHDRRRR